MEFIVVNKRAAPRFPVTLDVAVTFPGNIHRVCTIRDYCTSGMYLLCGADAEQGMPTAKDDMLDIEFSNPLKPREPRYLVTGRVARMGENGFGIAFTGQNSAAIAALSQLAESQAAASREAAAVPGEREVFARDVIDAAIAECRNKVAEDFTQVLQVFFTRANDALFNKAGEAKSNAQQSVYFGAMNELKKAQAVIRQTFIERLSEVFGVLTTGGYQPPYSQQEGQASGELSLVESDELDRWLAVRAMAAKLEERMGDTLEALELRFEAISTNPITLENNPVGPFVIASVFRESLETLVLEDVARTAIFVVMEGVLSERLNKLYDELNGLLIARGILPHYTKKLEVVRPAGGSSVSPAPQGQQDAAPGSPAKAAPVYGGQSPAVAVQPATVERPVTVAPASVSASAVTGAAPAAAPPAMPVANVVTYTRPGGGGMESERTSAAIHQGLQELMRLQQETAPGSDSVAPPAAGYYTSGEVMQALSHLEQAVAQIDRETVSALDHVHYLAQSLNEVIGDEGKALTGADREKVTYVGGLLSSILQDQLVPQYAKPWFSTLEIPLLKAGLLDASLVEDEAHPARQLLNRLESIGDRLQGDDSPQAQEVRQRIEGVIGGVRENVENDANVFTKALDDLETVEEEFRESYEANVAQLIAELEKETELNRARQRILEDLNHRLGQREVPKVVLELLDRGWKNLLLRTYLKSGAESSAYQTYLNVIDQLYARLMETMPYSKDAAMPDDTLQEWLERMLAIVSDDDAGNALFIETVHALLTGELESAMATQYVPALISKMLHKEHHAEADKPESVADDIWQLMLLDASEVQEGEIFCLRDTEGEEQQVSMIWHNEEAPRYVFVDNAGHKRLDQDLGELANLFYQGKLSRLGEKSLSVTERATYHFLQSLHGQLAYQAQHDELTGLLNRKAFERELEEAFGEAKRGEATHVLGYIDLDRFNVINTSCGHAEGDILLTRVAKVLQEALGEEAVLSRLGGDEFGILLKNCSRTNGLKMITAVHDAIRDMQFVCENNEFKVTASIGLAEINELSDSSGRLLSAVDAATFTAKDMGRDNIQIYNAENERISSRRNILDWVGRINVLFDKNLIQLRCQKIKPLHATVNSLPHYEVLLDVKDEEGNKVPLEEFIVAAERYNRIIDIDTWVVDYVLNWMDERRDKLDRITAMAINLSGSSLGNRKFMEHIEQALSRPGFPAEKVCFEITESIAINNLDNTSRFMRKIKDTGCQFSLDDFGTGTSSYSYLKSLPIDYLKIDGAFVKDIATNSHDYAVVKSINEIGHAMGKKTVAEYVENEFAYEALKQIGIDYVQGFGVEKPIPLFKLFG